MRLLYLLPGNIKKGLGEAEFQRRGEVLQSIAGPGVTIEIADVPTGPSCIECMCDEYQAIPGVIEATVQAEKDGFDGRDHWLRRRSRCRWCAGDGKDPRHWAGAGILCGVLHAGPRFSVITPLQELLGTTEELVKKCGLGDSLASIRSTDITVLDINRNPGIAAERTLEEAQKCRDLDRADCVTLGCMSLAFAKSTRRYPASWGSPLSIR